MKARSTVTVNDVARSAGVSVGTVSRVLNRYANVTKDNFDKVQKAIDELGYEKCRSAEQLVSRRNGSRVQTGNIGMVYAEMSGGWANHPLVAAYSMGVERACQERGFHALIEFSEDNTQQPRCVRENKIDGLLIKATRNLPAYFETLPKDLPVVGVGFNEPSSRIQQVAPDNRGAGWLAADYLWNLGHRRIGFMCANLMHPMFLARFQGYEGYMRSKRALNPAYCSLNEHDDTGIVPEQQPPDMEQGLRQIVDAPGERVTALIAANDWTAFGLYMAMAKLGLRVPDDISIMGFDNATVVCTSLQPQLTSFAIPLGAVAYAAAIKVIDRIQTPSSIWEQSLHLIGGEMVERASVRTISLPSSP